jgi:putative ABC transport system substrate-binding protein
VIAAKAAEHAFVQGGGPMRRRAFLAIFCAVLIGPSCAGAQSPRPVIGFLNSGAQGPFAQLVAGFQLGLKDGGYIEGQNVNIEYRWAEGHYDRLPVFAADLVRNNVAVISATGGTVSARAAAAATTSIPVVFLGGADPVGDGLVVSFQRPGGNVTGVSTFTTELAPKRLQWLRELMPKARKFATLMNPGNSADVEMQDQQAATRAGLQALAFKARTEDDLEPAFISAVQQGAEALLVSADPFFNSRRNLLVALAAKYALPAAYPWREYAEAGGLMSYGTSLAGAYRQVGGYVGRILKGDKPAELPVQNPNKFELIINLKTAKSLKIAVPRIVLGGADAVIE